MAQQEIKQTRLNKYISESGHCSRREADKLIEQGRVTINGIVPEMGTKVSPGDKVAVDGRPINKKEKRIYIALNKPVGITCTSERQVQGNIVEFINYPTRIFPIGRLDKPSEGLIFLTNDGDIVNKILRAGNAHEKEYLVKVDQKITDQFIRGMGRGVPILDTVTKPCKITKIGPYEFKIILTQGLNQQIRRMCEHFGYEVKALKRTRIMNIDLKGLATGQWRLLTEKEMVEINTMVEGSSKTEEASTTSTRKPGSKSKHSTRGVNSAARQKRFGIGEYADKSERRERKPANRGKSKATGSDPVSKKFINKNAKSNKPVNNKAVGQALKGTLSLKNKK